MDDKMTEKAANQIDFYNLPTAAQTIIPDIDSKDYVRHVEQKYDNAVQSAISQLASGRISNDELARMILDAALEYNQGMREHCEAINKLEEEERALAEFDKDLAEQLRIERKINDYKRARIKQAKEQKRQEKLLQQLNAARQQGNLLNQQLAKIENDESRAKRK